MPAAASELDLLRLGAQQLQLSLSEETLQRLMDYQAELIKWNAAYNLTAIRDPRQMVVRHLLDSLALLPYVRGRVLDVGAGAGLPGLVLAIADPSLSVTTLDSNGKKARFMRHAVRSLGLPNADVVEGRVEAYQPTQPFDTVTSRAFAALGDFLTQTAHLRAAGGQWVAMKGKLDAWELAAIPATAKHKEHRLQVPGLDEDRHAVIVWTT